MADIGQVHALEVAGGIVGMVQLAEGSAAVDMVHFKLCHLALQDVLQQAVRQKTIITRGQAHIVKHLD